MLVPATVGRALLIDFNFQKNILLDIAYEVKEKAFLVVEYLTPGKVTSPFLRLERWSHKKLDRIA